MTSRKFYSPLCHTKILFYRPTSLYLVGTPYMTSYVNDPFGDYLLFLELTSFESKFNCYSCAIFSIKIQKKKSLCESCYRTMAQIFTRIGQLGFGLAIAGAVANSALYNVDGGHRAVIFDRVSGVNNIVVGEGTHFMIPWIQVSASVFFFVG